MARDWARARFVGLTAHTAVARGGHAASPRVLLVRPDHLGDVLLSSPAINALRQSLPHARLDALVGPWGADALAHCAELDGARALAFPGFERRDKRAPWHPYALLERAARDLRAQAYDAAVILRPDHWWGAALAARAGIPVRIGYALAPGAVALTDALARVPREHAVRSAWRLARVTASFLGASVLPAEDCDPASAPLRWSVTAKERTAARRWLAAHGIAGAQPYLVLHPGAGAPVKHWGPANWASVLERITHGSEVAIILAGMPEERALLAAVAEALAGRCPSHVFISGQGIGMYAALIAGARLMLGVDSGPLHLAVALGTPSVRLYGPIDPGVFGPWGSPERHVALASGLACAPCGQLDFPLVELPWHPCMALLAPGVVARAALRVMADTPPVALAVAGGDVGGSAQGEVKSAGR
jgi:ADP-heptose:LPS heptosyltransferase